MAGQTRETQDQAGREEHREPVNISLDEAKKRFLESAAKIDPFRPVKNRPFISIGCAFLSGVLCAAMQKKIRNLPVMPLMLDGADLIIQYLLDKKK